MNEKILELTGSSRARLDVQMHYYGHYGTPRVRCTLIRPYRLDLPVSALSDSEDDALARALDLLEKVRELEKRIDKALAPPQEDYLEGRYTRQRVVDDTWIETRAKHGRHVVTKVFRQDGQGFVYREPPTPVTDDYKPLSHGKDTSNSVWDDLVEEASVAEMDPDEKMYYWNDLGFLSGSAGLAIVKDGMIVRAKGVLMA